MKLIESNLDRLGSSNRFRFSDERLDRQNFVGVDLSGFLKAEGVDDFAPIPLSSRLPGRTSG